ncbi:MAG: DUF4838 domain-containing protein [Planctomycetota bacterium]|nr:DUF4838 domain-containing protein [Planctomycetota bacterium]
MSGPNSQLMEEAVDNNFDTAWTSPAHQSAGLGVLIDLKKNVFVHRVFMTPGRHETWFPRSLRILVGESPETLELVTQQKLRKGSDKKPDYGSAIRFHPQTDVSFEPRRGRFVRIEIGEHTAGYPWSIAELGIFAASRSVAENRWSAVTVDDDAPSTIQLAARELAYYLTELLDVPARIVSPKEAGNYRGLRVRLVTPDPPKLPYPELDPAWVEDVSVVEEGEDIVISGPTQRAVLYGVYELLDQLGVRWLYPDSHGDYVPRLRRFPRSILPIRYRPPFRTRYANFPADRLASKTNSPDSRLFFVRHHFNNSWGNGLSSTLSGIPPRMNLGFGYIHNFDRIIPESVIEKHPEWTPGPYRKGWTKVPCTSHPGVISHVVERIKSMSKGRPELQGFSIHPKDVPAFCECERCTGLFGQPRKVQPEKPDELALAFDYSNHYFHLIGEVAKQIQQELPGKGIFALAYANHGKPPSAIEKLPANVMVDYTLHWKHNLPAGSPKNLGYKNEIEAWTAKCKLPGIYDYVLIHTDTTSGRPAGEWYTLVPLVSAIADHHRFFQKLGMTSVGTQAMGDICRSSPWSVYAWARTAWKPGEPTADVLDDFFEGFYLDAARPMLKFYRTLEDHIIKNDIAITGPVGTYRPTPEAFPAEIVERMRAHLRKANKRANTWYVKQRIAYAAKCLDWSYAVAHQNQKQGVYPCHRISKVPKIDGRADDPAWRSLPEVTGFLIATSRNYARTRQTRFRIGWDDENIYVSAHCIEPNMKAVIERNPKDTGFLTYSTASWSKFYHDLLEIFWAPSEPIYFQTMVNVSGQIVGPMRLVGHMHNSKPASREGFECRTHHGDGWWEMEMKFPFATAEKKPADGDRWRLNFVRVTSQEKGLGEQFSGWPHLGRFNFHDRVQFNSIVFHDRPITDTHVRKTGRKLNQAFLDNQRDYEQFKAELTAFDKTIEGKDNVCQRAGTRIYGTGRNPHALGGGGNWSRTGPLPHTAEIIWKEPVEINAIRIDWGSRKEFPTSYGLEWYDGKSYRPLAENHKNRYETSIHELDTIKARRLRLTVFKIEGASNVSLGRRLQAFKR